MQCPPVQYVVNQNGWLKTAKYIGLDQQRPLYVLERGSIFERKRLRRLGDSTIVWKAKGAGLSSGLAFESSLYQEQMALETGSMLGKTSYKFQYNGKRYKWRSAKHFKSDYQLFCLNPTEHLVAEYTKKGFFKGPARITIYPGPDWSPAFVEFLLISTIIMADNLKEDEEWEKAGIEAATGGI
ncbi:hypothetical protein IWQ62_001050 [Dispira parvispora]|uniref:Uncharacterized protein n=1 Tax=Dispira parvispora TaxID=1520584 RepID=A0A9W8E902_9FUNG|nr:hypothetical protein IWQ62_001050 [Dispira parvispora]